MKLAQLKAFTILMVVGMCGLVASSNVIASPVGTLNELIETARDGQNGYAAAADAVKDPTLKGLFRSYSEQRGNFVEDLQKKVSELGGKPENTGTVGAKIHRGWIDLKAAISRGDERAILAEAEKGDAVAVKVYEDALANPELPASIRGVVEKQAAEVRAAYEKVQSLENKEANANKQDWENKKEEMQAEVRDWKNDVKSSTREPEQIDELKDNASKTTANVKNKIEE